MNYYYRVLFYTILYYSELHIPLITQINMYAYYSLQNRVNQYMANYTSVYDPHAQCVVSSTVQIYVQHWKKHELLNDAANFTAVNTYRMISLGEF